MTYPLFFCKNQQAWWRNGSASDSSSEGCVFKSRPGHLEVLNMQPEGPLGRVEETKKRVVLLIY